MPNESQDLNYIKGYGDNELEIVTAKEITTNIASFDDNEMKRLNARLESIFKWSNREGVPAVLTKAHYSAIVLCALNAKKVVFNNESFVGDGVNGWGAFDIVPEDVYGNANDRTWELGNGLVAAPAGNWVVGAAASHWTRNDMGFAQRNTGTFPATAGYRPIDAAQDKWSMVYFGVADLAGVGLAQGHVYGLMTRERGYHEFTNQMQIANMLYSDLGQCVYIAGGDQSLRSAHILRPVTVAPAAAIAQVMAIRPIGVSFISQTRATQQGTLAGPLTA